MTLKRFLAACVVIASFGVGFYLSGGISLLPEEEETGGHAADAFSWWYGQRAAPYESIPVSAYQKAHRQFISSFGKKGDHRSIEDEGTTWRSLGPANFAGRILSLAIDPSSPNVIWAGSASGGLWKSTTRGIGANAWSYVETGFPTVAVSSLVIDPTNTSVMYLGTGEISLYKRPLIGTPGARASYGMGILKSTDGGSTWSQTSLTWTFADITAIPKIVINPRNTQTLYAATSEGTYKSIDGGDSWAKVHEVLMAMDIVINPVDTTVLYVVCGNAQSTSTVGLYKSTDAGGTWNRLSGGLPSADPLTFGRSALALSPSNPNVVYAGITNAGTYGIIGLYRTTDAGVTWMQRSTTAYVGGQGWYNNAVAVHPQNPDTLWCAGLDIYRSSNGGTLTRASRWTEGFSFFPPGGPEGSSVYAHADHHAIAIDPTNPRQLYFGNDGGVFASSDGGVTFEGRNGGLVTTQFYPGFANALNDSTIAVGGLQDNGTLKYTGSTTWRQIDFGDGGWCAIDPTNPLIIYDEYVYLALSRSTNGGSGFTGITNGLPTGSSNSNFVAPMVISRSHPTILYAGAKNVYKTTNRGDQWFSSNGATSLNGTKIAVIAVSATSPDTLLAATGSGALRDSPLFQVFASTNGGAVWTNVTGSLPSRYPTDIEFDEKASATAYLTYSGFGASHVFKTTNVGASWTDITSNLPDVPHQAVTIDSDDNSTLYVGNDLGVFRSTDEGASWEDFGSGMPMAMVLDLTISKANGALRASTFGNGVFERHLPRQPTLTLSSPAGGESYVSDEKTSILWDARFINAVRIEFTSDSGATWETIADSLAASSQSFEWTIPTVRSMECLIRISEESAAAVIDTSGSVFSIYVNPDIYRGWNLISLDRNLSDRAVSSVLPEAISNAFAFEGAYLVEDSLSTGAGYWVKFAAPQDLDFGGDEISADTIQLSEGWNLIGSLSSPMPVSDISTTPDDIIATAFFGYRGGYFMADTIASKRGFWVKSHQAGVMTLSSGNSLVTATKASLRDSWKKFAERDILATLSFRDASGYRQSLYLLHEGTATAEFELPPPPPSGSPDVRFVGDRYAAAVSERSRDKDVSVAIQGNIVEVELKYSGEHESVNISLESSEGTQLLSGEGKAFLVANQTALRVKIEHDRMSEVAADFSLDQNYPNPFNPSTIITYAVPNDGWVKLSIFDITGREVVRLVDGQKSKGSHEIRLNAHELSSGVYVYVLESVGRSLAKKLVIMK